MAAAAATATADDADDDANSDSPAKAVLLALAMPIKLVAPTKTPNLREASMLRVCGPRAHSDDLF